MSGAERETLKSYLDRVVAKYDRRYLATDPVAFPHRYKVPEDQEVVGLVASSLAYGNVPAIRRSVARALLPLGPRPAAVLDRFSPASLLRAYRNFRHRFTSGRDLAAMLWVVREMRRSHGSIGGFFGEGYQPEAATIREALTSFVRRALDRDLRPFYGRRCPAPGQGIRFLLPSPAEGSGCKRLNLYLRWMVRKADGVDLGIWPGIATRQLVMPVDTHIARIAGYIGLTRRVSPGWKMAEEITASLREIDAGDPVRYDFALCRLGILDACPRRRDPVKCAACPLQPVCRL